MTAESIHDKRRLLTGWEEASRNIFFFLALRPLKMKPLRCLATSGTKYPVTQRLTHPKSLFPNLGNTLVAYGRINSTKSPASGAGNVSEPRLMSQV